MKTEQEQIERMARTMCGYCSTDGKCAVSKNLREPDICANVDTQYCLYKEHAEQLVENGYGDVSEYKAEIEQLKADNEALTMWDEAYTEENEKLKAENTTLYEVRNNLLEENDKLLKDNVALILGKKQAKIDVLNELKERITKDRVANDTVVINANYEIKELIKEIENGN